MIRYGKVRTEEGLKMHTLEIASALCRFFGEYAFFVWCYGVRTMNGIID